MTFDSTAIAIIIGLGGAVFYASIELYRHKELEVINSVVVFLALYAVFAGYELIAAALYGDPNNLPKSWREYLGVAGVVGIGLSLQHIIKTFKKLFVKPGQAKKTNKAASG
jgi:hypothetical protein